jgi:hypothetical protein
VGACGCGGGDDAPPGAAADGPWWRGVAAASGPDSGAELAARRGAAQDAASSSGPLSPLLAVAGTNRRGGCARGCSKPLEPLVCLGEVCFSLFRRRGFLQMQNDYVLWTVLCKRKGSCLWAPYSTWPAGLVISPLAQVCPALEVPKSKQHS